MADISNYELFNLNLTGDQIKAVLTLINSKYDEVEELIDLKTILEAMIEEYETEQTSGKEIDGGTY